MALFGKKKPKLTPEEIKEQIDRSVEQTEDFVRKAERKRRDLLDRAKTAKSRGDKMSYNMAISALRTIMIQQKRAEQMVLSMQVMQDLRDVNELTGSFMQSMEMISTQMSQMPDLKRMGKVAEEFNQNMEKAAHQGAVLDEYMTAMSDSMSAMDYDGVPLDDEIGQAIESQLAMELDAEDVEIARRLEEARRQLGE